MFFQRGKGGAYESSWDRQFEEHVVLGDFEWWDELRGCARGCTRKRQPLLAFHEVVFQPNSRIVPSIGAFRKELEKIAITKV